MASVEKSVVSQYIHRHETPEEKATRDRDLLQHIADESDGGSKPVSVRDIDVSYPHMDRVAKMLLDRLLVKGETAPGVLLTVKGLAKLKRLGGASDVVPVEPKPEENSIAMEAAPLPPVTFAPTKKAGPKKAKKGAAE